MTHTHGSPWETNKGSDASKGMSWRRRRKATAVEPRVKEMGERRKQRLPLCPFPARGWHMLVPLGRSRER